MASEAKPKVEGSVQSTPGKRCLGVEGVSLDGAPPPPPWPAARPPGLLRAQRGRVHADLRAAPALDAQSTAASGRQVTQGLAGEGAASQPLWSVSLLL